MRTFTTFFAAGLMFLTTTTAFAVGNPMMTQGHAYSTPGARAVVRYAPTYRVAVPVQVTEGRRSLSVEPGALPAAMPTRAVAPTYRNPHPNTPTWLLPKTDAHKFNT